MKSGVAITLGYCCGEIYYTEIFNSDVVRECLIVDDWTVCELKCANSRANLVTDIVYSLNYNAQRLSLVSYRYSCFICPCKDEVNLDVESVVWAIVRKVLQGWCSFVPIEANFLRHRSFACCKCICVAINSVVYWQTLLYERNLTLKTDIGSALWHCGFKVYYTRITLSNYVSEDLIVDDWTILKF